MGGFVRGASEAAQSIEWKAGRGGSSDRHRCGGTFTDFVLVDVQSGRIVYHKQPSTPHDPALAVMQGTAALMARADERMDRVELVVHGTTIALNAILQRRGVRLGLVVSPGNRDILEIARVRMSDSYDFFALPEPPLASRDRVLEIPARIGADGQVVGAPTAEDYDRIAQGLRAIEAQAVVVVLLNAHAHPALEQTVAEALAERLAVPVSASSAIWAEKREYERAMVSVMNAYITPLIHTYYHNLKAGFAALGVQAPISITTSNGGSVDIETALERPVDSLLSGPASGVVAAIQAAHSAGLSRIVTFDMGGTSADIAIAEGSEPEITSQATLGELPLILPVVNVNAIGAGGGSIVRVDGAGFLKVGPTSAGADPGPACFGKGGLQATVTDCYVVCGFLDPLRFAGGSLTLRPERAQAALEAVAEGLGLRGADTAARAADAALRVASSMMATEVRKALARRGADAQAFTLAPYGGAGPTHAALLAEEAGLDRILVAPRPGVLCALGAAIANLRRDFVTSCHLRLPSARAPERLLALLESVRADALAWRASLGERAKVWRFALSADCRYPDEAFALPVNLDAPTFDLADAERLTARFHQDHAMVYGFNEPSAEVLVGRLVLSLIGELPRARLRGGAEAIAEQAGERRVFLGGQWMTAKVVSRSALAAGAMLTGPAIIEQDDTTTVLPAGWGGERVADGSLLLTRIKAQAA
jgi:N-methylhydantoinase A